VGAVLRFAVGSVASDRREKIIVFLLITFPLLFSCEAPRGFRRSCSICRR